MLSNFVIYTFVNFVYYFFHLYYLKNHLKTLIKNIASRPCELLIYAESKGKEGVKKNVWDAGNQKYFVKKFVCSKKKDRMRNFDSIFLSPSNII